MVPRRRKQIKRQTAAHVLFVWSRLIENQGTWDARTNVCGDGLTYMDETRWRHVPIGARWRALRYDCVFRFPHLHLLRYRWGSLAEHVLPDSELVAVPETKLNICAFSLRNVNEHWILPRLVRDGAVRLVWYFGASCAISRLVAEKCCRLMTLTRSTRIWGITGLCVSRVCAHLADV